MRRQPVAWGTGLLLAALGVLCLPVWQACSSRPAESPVQASVTRKSAPPVRASSATPHGDREPDRFDLEQAVPLLARPELRLAMEALDDDDASKALRIVTTAAKQVKPGEREARRWHYLLGMLAERAGQAQQALKSYEAAAQHPWALSPYAQLGAARAERSLGNEQAALTRLLALNTPGPLAPTVDALIAEMAQARGDVQLAMAHQSAFLAAEPRASAWSQVALSYAKNCIEQAEAQAAADGTQATQASLLMTQALHFIAQLRRQAAADQQELQALQQRAVTLLPKEQQAAAAKIPNEDRRAEIEALLEQRRWEDADQAAQDLSNTLKAEALSALDCEVRLLRVKALGGQNEWGKGVDLLGDVMRQCKDADLLARAGYLGGKYAFYDKRYKTAIELFAQVEQNPAQGTLGDDARLYRALAYKELGDDARCADLLSKMPEDYPEGDMSREGAFRLALEQLEKGDFATAIPLLEKAATLEESLAHPEQLGREDYFLARARIATGARNAGLDELDALIETRPLSYYMLHAYTRLHEADAARAQAAVQRGRSKAAGEPFVFARSTQLSDPGFERALELLQVGDVEAAATELDASGVREPNAAPNLLWGVALLYQRLGAARMSHRLVRTLREHWLERWPAGPWTDAWQLAFPRPYTANVMRAATKNGVSPALVYAVMREESAFDPKAISPVHAMGLMQLMGSTARAYAGQVGLPATEQALLTPRVNIAYGSFVLAKFAQQFPNNALLAIPGYNAGPSRPKRWLKEIGSNDFDLWVELIPFRETRNYTKRVLASRAAYAYLYEGEDERALRLPLEAD